MRRRNRPGLLDHGHSRPVDRIVRRNVAGLSRPTWAFGRRVSIALRLQYLGESSIRILRRKDDDDKPPEVCPAGRIDDRACEDACDGPTLDSEAGRREVRALQRPVIFHGHARQPDAISEDIRDRRRSLRKSGTVLRESRNANCNQRASCRSHHEEIATQHHICPLFQFESTLQMRPRIWHIFGQLIAETA
jgi:hypothetical protein